MITFTVDNMIMAMDRDTGRLLWKEKREHMPSKVTPIEQSGLLLFETKYVHEVINPAQQVPVLRIAKPIQCSNLVGRYGIWQVKSWGWRDREGIALFDYLANQEVMFEAIDGVDDDVACVMGFHRVFCATNDGDKICYAPNGVPTALREGHRIQQLAVVCPTLFALMAKHEGTRTRRVLGLDPQNLAVRFDLGELSREPSDNEDKQILALPDWRSSSTAATATTITASSGEALPPDRSCGERTSASGLLTTPWVATSSATRAGGRSCGPTTDRS